MLVQDHLALSYPCSKECENLYTNSKRLNETFLLNKFLHKLTIYGYYIKCSGSSVRVP